MVTDPLVSNTVALYTGRPLTVCLERVVAHPAAAWVCTGAVPQAEAMGSPWLTSKNTVIAPAGEGEVRIGQLYRGSLGNAVLHGACETMGAFPLATWHALLCAHQCLWRLSEDPEPCPGC